LIAAHFYVDVFGFGVGCGDVVKDTNASKQAFLVGFICLDKEVIDYETKSSRFVFTDK